jgi:hypothetical protein
MRFKASAARSLLAGLVLALSATTALPQTTSLYTVEIIVFRNAGGEGALPPNAVLPTVLDDGIEVTPATPARLNTAARKLESSGEFKVLARAAWTQGPSAWPQGVAWTACPGASATQLGLDNGINGKVYLLRRDQLNLGLDLVFEEGGRRFQLQEVRTVRSNAINYFDHPAFGVLAIISAAGN